MTADILTQPELIHTDAPFVEQSWVPDPAPSNPPKGSQQAPNSPSPAPRGHYEMRASADKKIEVASCSEFMHHHEPLNLFNIDPSVNGHRNASFRLIHDATGQQLVFTVGNTGHLYCLSHVNGATSGWQAKDVTPKALVDAKKPVAVFDVLQVGLEVHIGAAGAGVLYHAQFSMTSLGFDGATDAVVGLNIDNQDWTAITNNLGVKDISSLRICPSTNDAKFRIVVGTAEQSHAGIASTYYHVDPSPSAKNLAWKPSHLPEAAVEVFGLQPAATDWSIMKEGVYVLYKQKGGSLRIALSGFKASGEPTEDIMVDHASDMGDVKDISVSTNPWKTTDLLVAGKGIGFFDINKLQNPPILLLPNVNFAHVVAAERGISSDETRITVLAISTNNELYFAEGRRKIQDSGEYHVSFPLVSGVPIRAGVTQVSSMFNKSSYSSEFLYTSNENDGAVHHLIRDPSTSHWNETSLKTHLITQLKEQAASQDSGITFPAYITKITFSNGAGSNVPMLYPVNLSCESPLHVSVNGRSYNLTSQPQQVLTDGSGQIEIVAKVHGLLGAPQYHFSLFKFCTEAEKSKSYSIQPAQRVIRMLNKMTSADALKNAKQTDGKLVFPPGSVSDDAFNSMGGLMAQFPNMMKTLSNGTEAGDDAGADSPPGAKPVDYIIDEHGKLQVYVPKAPQPSGFETAVSKVGEVIGDVVELLKSGFKAVFRVAVRILGPVIKLYLKFQDFVLEFVVKKAISLLRTVAHFLKETLHLDLGKLCGFLGFLFDIDSIKSIQEDLKGLSTNIFNFSKSAITKTRGTLHDNINKVEKAVDDFLHIGPSPPSPQTSRPSMPSWMKLIFDNPIIHAILKFNPIGWALEVLNEESESIGLKINIPSFAATLDKLADAVAEWIQHSASKLMDLVRNIMAQLGHFLSDPTKAKDAIGGILGPMVTYLFDALRDLLKLMTDMFASFVEETERVLGEKWEIPILTKMWEAFADQEFSIINFVTFIIANFLNSMSLPFGGTDSVKKMLGRLKNGFGKPIDDTRWASKAKASVPTNDAPVTPVTHQQRQEPLAPHSLQYQNARAGAATMLFAMPSKISLQQAFDPLSDQPSESSISPYLILTIIATIFRSANTFLAGAVEHAMVQGGGGHPGTGGAGTGTGTGTGSGSVVVDIPGKPGHHVGSGKGLSLGAANQLRRWAAITGWLATLFEFAASFGYIYWSDSTLVTSEMVATWISIIFNYIALPFLVIASTPAMASVADGMLVAASVIMRIGQLIAGVIRLLGPIIDGQLNGPMMLMGGLNVIDSVAGGVSIFMPDPETQAMTQMGEMLLALSLIIFNLTFSLPVSPDLGF